MPKLGLGTGIGRSGIVTPGILTDGLVMKHMYPARAVQPVSDGAARFTGGDLINISDRTMDTDGNCCIMFWAKRTEVNSEDAILGYTSTNTERYIRFDNLTTLDVESNTNGDIANITLPNPNTYNWHHYAIVSTSGTLTAYQDGVSCSVTNPDMSDDTTFNVIGGSGGGKSFEGYLCNLGLWSNSFTQAQIKNLMWKSFNDLTTDEKNLGLIHWYDLSENANDPQGGNNGTVGP
jgi:hypothetical protein